MPVHQSDVPDADTPPPPETHKHIYNGHTHQSSCDSWKLSKLPVWCAEQGGIDVCKRKSSNMKREQHQWHTQNIDEVNTEKVLVTGQESDTITDIQVRIREQCVRGNVTELQKSRQSLNHSHTQRFGPDQPER